MFDTLIRCRGVMFDVNISKGHHGAPTQNRTKKWNKRRDSEELWMMVSRSSIFHKEIKYGDQKKMPKIECNKNIFP